MTLPLGPTSPAIIQSLSWTFGDPLRHLQRLHDRYGDTFTLRLLGPEMSSAGNQNLHKYKAVVLCNPQHVLEVFRDSTEAFGMGGAYSFLRLLFGNNSLFVAEGEQHVRHRQIIGKLLNTVQSKEGQALTWKVANAEIDLWKPGRRLVALDAFQRITFRIIYNMMFFDEEGLGIFRKHLSLVSKSLTSPMLMFPLLRKDWGRFSPGHKIDRARNKVRGLIEQDLIHERQAPPADGIHFIRELLETKDDEGRQLTTEELVDEVLTLLATGFESTGISLSFLLYHLLSDTSALDELTSIVDRFQLPEELPELLENSALHHFCKESLRLHPVVPIIVRKVDRAVRIGDYELEPGQFVVPCLYLVHRRIDVFKDAESFKPSRFAEGHLTASDYMPFGGGARHCVGKSFALQTMKMVVVALLRRVKLTLLSRQSLRTERRHITIIPSNGVPIKVTSLR